MAGETVLIVEDRRENIVHLANNVLRPHGYQVLTAMDGQRGLRRILSDRPDLVIMDLNMPKMDGLEVLAALRQQQISIPVILTTFYGSEQVAHQALSLGAADYVVKPYDTADMLRAIEKALAPRNSEPARPPARAEAHESMDQAMPLTRQVERWMRDMNILNRVGKALVAQLDLERVYVRAVEAAIYVTRSDYACLYLPAEAGHLRLRGIRGPHDPRAHLVDVTTDSGLAVDVASVGEAEIRARGPGDPALFALVGSALGPAVAAPLRWQQETLGVLLAARRPEEASFVEGDAEWLSGLADYAAIAVRNARIYTSAQAAAPAEPAQAVLSAAQQELEALAADLQAATERLHRLAAMVSDTPKDGSDRG
ncbi:MAG TPA: response regulator [Anaerolineae bacterium]|nr:response regulator [Anaerolineae bacterium]